MAAMAKIPTIIQEEQKFFQRLQMALAKQADKICVAYENLRTVFL
jgi:hypothetical protein